MTLCNDLLDTRPVRAEIDRRELAGQVISGRGGEGGAFAMRTAEERKKRISAEHQASLFMSALHKIYFSSRIEGIKP